MEDNLFAKRQKRLTVVDPTALERIKNNQCPSCGKPKTDWNRRTDWRCCSSDCTDRYVNELLEQTDWRDVRRRVFRRDNYSCVMCGKSRKKKLIADHIAPISLGGDAWDMKNLQTLCTRCNKIKTKEDLKRIAEMRKDMKRWEEK
ncbi:MAG: HNH endonuclease signature motif containing protein [Nanoarchaeota archaeon]|nr:HNH endonuclease signature motif containing protein [Nanoarchaeota archaeon]